MLALLPLSLISNLHFVVGRGSETQPQVGDNLLVFAEFWTTHLKILKFEDSFHFR